MTPVIDLLEFKSQTVTPTLVLVGLHYHPEGIPENTEGYRRILANCRSTLERARARGVAVAHVRNITPRMARERVNYPAWIAGFEPGRTDMVFDVLQPSCYSNTEFSRAMDYSNGHFAIAGLFGETSCLSTAIDAHHRRHDFIYLSDASVCRNNGAIPATLFHDAVSQVMSVYGKVTEGAKWSLSLSQKKKAPV